jgi:hypothetical protein
MNAVKGRLASLLFSTLFLISLGIVCKRLQT